MKMVLMMRIGLMACCVSGLFAFDAAELAKRSDRGFAPITVKDWQAPDEKNIPNNLFGDTVRYGKALVSETYKYIGPEVKNKKMLLVSAERLFLDLAVEVIRLQHFLDLQIKPHLFSLCLCLRQ